MDLFLITLSLSLVDSFSTAQQIIFFALMLTTFQPIKNSLAFLFGLSFAYFFCGLLGFLAFAELHSFLEQFFPSSEKLSDPQYYQIEFFSGLLMLLFGLWYWRKKHSGSSSFSQNFLLMRLQAMRPQTASLIGAFVSASSFPLALPYLYVLGKYSKLHLNTAAATAYIGLYNIGYALPMLFIFGLYLYFHYKENTSENLSENLSEKVREKTHRLNIQLTAWTFILLGLFSMLNSGAFFALGRAILNGRMF